MGGPPYVIKGYLDSCCVGVPPKGLIYRDAGRDRITATVACLWCGVARGNCGPPGFFRYLKVVVASD